MKSRSCELKLWSWFTSYLDTLKSKGITPATVTSTYTQCHVLSQWIVCIFHNIFSCILTILQAITIARVCQHTYCPYWLIESLTVLGATTVDNILATLKPMEAPPHDNIHEYPTVCVSIYYYWKQQLTRTHLWTLSSRTAVSIQMKALTWYVIAAMLWSASQKVGVSHLRNSRPTMKRMSCFIVWLATRKGGIPSR